MVYKLAVVTWNSNGIKNKIAHLINFLETHKVDIMLLTETKLTQADKIKIKGYTFYRQDRPNSTGGGVAILVKSCIAHTLVPLAPNPIEAICIKTHDNIHIVSAYNRPLNLLKERDLSQLINIGRKVLIAGDLNAKHVNWNCNINNRNGNTVFNFQNTTNVIVDFSDKPTHIPPNNMSPTTIDIVLNKNTLITKPVSLPELNSDHNPVKFSITTNTRPESHLIKITSFKDTNWDSFRKTVNDRVIINNNITSAAQLEEEVSKLTKILQHAKTKHTKLLTINNMREKLPDNIKIKINHKNALRRLWQNTANIAYKHHMNRLSREITQEIREHRNTIWNTKLTSLKVRDNSLWNLTKALKKSHPPLPTLHDTNNDQHITNREKAEILATTFENAHHISTTNTIEQNKIEQIVDEFLNSNQNITNSNCWSKILTTPKEIYNTLKTLPNKKAPGTDNIDNKILKNLPRKALIQLCYIINSILKLQHFPQQWKEAIVIPIPKPNKNHSDPQNYRPISLLNTLAKVTEKIILNRINTFYLKNKITIACQFGFRPHHNTTMQLARITSDISLNYNKKQSTAMALLDIQQAFDRVWIKGLTYKLMQLKLPNIIIKLIYSYLTNRNFYVKVNTENSTIRQIAAGVPQGSVLGPKLFNLFINDIPQFAKTNLALYADDTAIYASSFHAQVATKQVQIHLDILQKYYQLWKIQINPTKTEFVVFTKKFTNVEIHTPLIVNKHKIETKQSTKYLGVILDKRLNFNEHLKTALKKSYIAMRAVYPLLINKNMSQSNKKMIYKALIQPIFLYAAPVWSNISRTNIRPLQVYQNKCLRLIVSKDRYTKIKTLHNLASIETIENTIKNMTTNFIRKQLKHSNLTKTILNKKIENSNITFKHKMPFDKIMNL